MSDGSTPGQRLYNRLHLDSGTTARGYYTMMNTGEKEHWERLGAEIEQEVGRLLREELTEAWQSSMSVGEYALIVNERLGIQ